jgi:hypothetical protein|eukprot:COSAG06_NODE_1819_length_8293_cov_39.705394_14_plen_73_part_00
MVDALDGGECVALIISADSWDAVMRSGPKSALCRAVLCYNRSFYQDRLGTHIGNVLRGKVCCAAGAKNGIFF